MKRAGDSFAFRFPTQSSTGALTNADSTPTGVMIQNGDLDAGVTVTVANQATGIYKGSGTIPATYKRGDRVQIQISATVGGVSAGAMFDVGTLGMFDSVEGSVSGTPTTTSIVGAAGLSSTDDAYKLMFLVFTSGTQKGIPREITGYVGSTRTFTTAAFPSAAAAGDTFAVIGLGA